MDADPKPPFEVQGRWKEEVVYWEGDEGFVFDAGWGADPRVLYVPSEEEWDAVTAEWMRGRREEIVARLAAHSMHVLKVDAYKPPAAARRVTR